MLILRPPAVLEAVAAKSVSLWITCLLSCQVVASFDTLFIGLILRKGLGDCDFNYPLALPLLCFLAALITVIVSILQWLGH